MKRKQPDDAQLVYDDVARLCANVPVVISDDESEEDEATRMERLLRRSEHLWQRAVYRRQCDVDAVVSMLTRRQLEYVDSVLAELGDDFEADFNDTSDMGGLFGRSKKKQEKLKAQRPVLIKCDCGGLCGDVALICRLSRWAKKELAGKQHCAMFLPYLNNVLCCEGEMKTIFGVEHIRDVRFAPLKKRIKTRT